MTIDELKKEIERLEDLMEAIGGFEYCYEELILEIQDELDKLQYKLRNNNFSEYSDDKVFYSWTVGDLRELAYDMDIELSNEQIAAIITDLRKCDSISGDIIEQTISEHSD